MLTVILHTSLLMLVEGPLDTQWKNFKFMSLPNSQINSYIIDLEGHWYSDFTEYAHCEFEE
jgi:hypothetical protein